jgi:hypothetical protein
MSRGGKFGSKGENVKIGGRRQEEKDEGRREGGGEGEKQSKKQVRAKVFGGKRTDKIKGREKERKAAGGTDWQI